MASYAIVETGAKQYKVKEGDTILVEKLKAKKDKEVSLDKVLLLVDGKTVTVGKPYVKDAKVVCEFLAEVKDEKKITFKYRKRKSSKRKIGHRQKLCRLLVKKIKV